MLPLFPLKTVLFPDGSLDLQIFEVRYLDMIGKCHRQGEPFGVVCLREGEEVRARSSLRATGDAFAVEEFADVGTLARIVEFSAPQAGLMVVRCRGGERFRILQREQLKHGLWTARVTALPADGDSPIPQDLQPIASTLARLIDAQQSGDPMLGALPLHPPYRLQDCGWVANRWSELLPLPARLKQTLMQLDNPLLRLELVGDLMSGQRDTRPPG